MYKYIINTSQSIICTAAFLIAIEQKLCQKEPLHALKSTETKRQIKNGFFSILFLHIKAVIFICDPEIVFVPPTTEDFFFFPSFQKTMGQNTQHFHAILPHLSICTTCIHLLCRFSSKSQFLKLHCLAQGCRSSYIYRLLKLHSSL